MFSVLIMLFMMGGVTWVVRYRYLNMYSRLPPEPQRKEPAVDLFPETQEEGVKSGLASYFDEFLSAIKIFGYLERPVFHELTRSMQTRKLIAGETLNLEEEQGFCLVVDGMVEIFVKSARDGRYSASGALFESSDDEEGFAPGRQRYQLLTEVRNGAPMSSLFSIMSLFTEDIEMHDTDDDDSPNPTPSAAGTAMPSYPMNSNFRQSTDTLPSIPGTPFSDNHEIQFGLPSAESLTSSPPAHDSSRIPPLSLANPRPAPPRRPVPKRLNTTSAHPDIIARATVDTTIAIIPASAFRRLIKIYPKATAHIVHVILSRFQRVTLATAYNYLGLSGEVLQMERNMLKYTVRQLPNHLRGDALDRLKEKFKRERERIGEKEVEKGIALHNAHAARRRRSAASLRKEVALQAYSKRRQSIVAATPAFGARRERPSPDMPSAGDLLTNAQQLRTGPAPPLVQARDAISPRPQRNLSPFSTPRNAHVSLDTREALDEDDLFRESVLECMFRAIGLTGNGTINADSTQASPRFAPMDQRRSRAGLGHTAFGFMEAFDPFDNVDTESVTSGGFNSSSPVPNPQLLAHDMKDEVEIVFFPKGSVLVEQGERNPGLYYVIDGFLDICVPGDDSSRDLLQSSAKADQEHASATGADAFGANSSRFPEPNMNNNFGAEQKKGKQGRRSVALIKPGGLAGYVGTISSYRSFIDVVARTDVCVGFLPLASIERIVDRYPIVLLTMAKRLTELLPRLLLHIDFALEWVQVNSGQVLFREGDESEAIYLVLNGRLRLVEDQKEGGMNVKAEFGQGESIGELEVLTESSRTGTLHAIRETELVKFPRTLFNSLAQEHPNITIKISKIIAARMRAFIDDPSRMGLKDNIVRSYKSSSTLNLRTVAILPVTAGVPVVEFGNRLMNALSQVGPPNGATCLNQAAILNHLGKHAFNKMGKLKLSQYLADLEEKYGLVVYVAGKLTPIVSPCCNHS